jgi:hypothetical protein
LYIKEPSQKLIFDSSEIYEESYDKAYHSGAYLKEDVINLLLDYDIWNPNMDKDSNVYKKNIEELKYAAYKNYFKTKELNSIKYQIREYENKIGRIAEKKHSLDYLTCEGVANYSKWNWIIENSVFYRDGSRYSWNEIPLVLMVSYYENATISSCSFRKIARNDPWRSMWSAGKKTGNLFGVPSVDLSKDQLLLCGFSSMYDNVYESAESPNEQVIEDDDCLDGWFIDQKRKMEQYKKEQNAENLLSSKISNSKEVFFVAENEEDIDNIHSMNTPRMNQIRKDRLNLVQTNKIIASDLQFTDVQEEIMIQNNKSFTDKIKGR